MENNMLQFKDAMSANYIQLKATMLTDLEKLKNAKNQVELAKSIYKKTLIKFREGIASSTELTLNQRQYIGAQAAYYAAIVETLNAKTSLQKLLTQAP